jgi:uncharacterized protein (TIGR02246 family)
MRHRCPVLVALALTATVVTASADPVRKAIEVQNAHFAAAVAHHDAAALAGMYTRDAMVLAPNADVVRGHDAIEAFWKKALESGVRKMTLTTIDVEAHGDGANEVGTYVMTGDDQRPLDRGKYVVVWRRDGGTWKLHRDIWNTSAPAGGR